MNQKEAGQLLDKYLQGKASQLEETIVQSWLIHETRINAMEDPGTEFPLPPKMWDAVHHAITQKRTRLWPRISIAAAVAAIIISAGIWFLKGSEKEVAIVQTTELNDVLPGKQGATLTLANGKKIRLSDAVSGELAKEAGVTISKSADGQITYEITDNSGKSDKVNTLSTANGETYRLRLPDGSLVWLNATSSLTYSANLVKNGKRHVTLTGEGYFEVAKDKAHPFIVSTNKQEVEVLGTHFNINSYPDEPSIVTTLLEGIVKVSSDNQKQMLKPGEQAANNGNAIKVGQADIENITDWKDGGFDLDHQNFKSVMRKIARWYNVDVIYDASVPDDLESGGWISRDEKLSAVLKAISSTGLARFRMEGRKLYVRK
jgi:transmembrane sensor